MQYRYLAISGQRGKVLSAIKKSEKSDNLLELIMDFVAVFDPSLKAAVIEIKDDNISFKSKVGFKYSILDEIGSISLDNIPNEWIVSVSNNMSRYYKDCSLCKSFSAFGEMLETERVQSCWNRSILDKSGKLIGAFVLFSDKKRDPFEEEVIFMEEVSMYLSLVMDKGTEV